MNIQNFGKLINAILSHNIYNIISHTSTKLYEQFID